MAESILSDLAGAPAPAAPDAEVPALSPGANQDSPPMLVLRAISNGQIPGAYMPKDAKPGEATAGVEPGDFSDLGIGVYRPKDPKLVAVAYNVKQVSEKMLQEMDKRGELTKNFPSLPDLLNRSSAPAEASEEISAPSTPVSKEGPVKTNQILPRPTSASDPAAEKRIRDLSKEPSKRAVPGAGSVLNGLISRAY